MSDCINISLNNQTFKTDAVVIGANAQGPAVAGLTVYGDISASGRLYGIDTGIVKIKLIGNGGKEYELPFYPSPNASDYIVTVDGVLQEAIFSYRITDNSPRRILFTDNILIGSAILILVIRAVQANSTNVPTFKKNQFVTTYYGFRYTLSFYSNENPENYLVYLDGVMQSPQDDYTIQGNQIVLTTSPADGQKLLVMSLQNADGTYSASVQSGAGQGLPLGASDGQALVYRSLIDSWTPQYILPTGASNGQSLVYNNTSKVWSAQHIIPTEAQYGQALVYNGSWVPQYILPATASNGQVLAWNGSTWAPQTADFILKPATASNGQSLVYNGSWIAQNILPPTATSGQVLTWNGTAWIAQNVATQGTGIPIGPATGDLGGVYPGPSVTKIQGFAVNNTAPTAFQILTWNTSTNSWMPSAVPRNPLPSSATGGQILTWSASTNSWVASGAPISLPTGANGQILVYNGSTNSWVASAIPGVVTNNVDNTPVGSVCWLAAITPPTGYLECNGSAVSVATYAELTTVIYCGNGNNATAAFGYRCTNASTPSTSRSTTGPFIVLPELRGEFIRGWDNGRSADTGRVFGSNQTDEFESHSHTIRSDNNNDNGTSGVLGGNGVNYGGFFAGRIGETGGTETRPRNVALLPCIKVVKTVTGSVSSLNFIQRPSSATNGQTLTYELSSNSWKAATIVIPDVTPAKAGGMAIYDQAGVSNWTIPTNVRGIKVHVIGGGGGVGASQQNGGDSIFSITTNSVPVAVTAKGGLAGSASSGGKGGDVVAVAANSTINFTGVGAGTGGVGGTVGNKGRAGTGSNGGYGGGGGGGTGGTSNVADSVPVGTVSWYAASAVPAGYLECNGSLVNISDYSDLYSVISTKYNYSVPRVVIGTIVRETASDYSNANDGSFTLTFFMDNSPIDQGVTMTLKQGIGNTTKTTRRGTAATFTGLDEHYGNMDVVITDIASGGTWTIILNVAEQRVTHRSAIYTAGQTIVLDVTTVIPESKFRIPDLRGEFIRGWDNGRGVDRARLFGTNQRGSHIAGDDGTSPAGVGIGDLKECNLDLPDGTARFIYYLNSAITLNTAASAYWGQMRPRNVALLPCIKATKTSSSQADSTGGGGGGSGFGGGGGGGASGMGGSGSGYGGSGKSDVKWADGPGGYGGGTTATGYAAGGGGGYAVFSLDVVPGSTASLTVGAAGTTSSPGAPAAATGAIIIEW